MNKEITGYVDTDLGVISFAPMGVGSINELERIINTGIEAVPTSEFMKINVGEFIVEPYGKDRNNFPYEIREIIKNNHLLPELIEKQIRFLYGQRPYLYKEEARGDTIVRVPVIDAQINSWLNSWKSNGIRDTFERYMQKTIREFYYCEGVWTKYRFTKAKTVAGLECMPNTECRFATLDNKYLNQNLIIDEKDFKYILHGNWLNPIRSEFNVYDKFNENKPFAFATAINYTANDSFGEKLYSYPVFFTGLRNWIVGANSVPRQLLSLFKNILTAKYHVKVPGAWIDMRENTLKNIIARNFEFKEANQAIVTEFEGATLVDINGNPLEYRVAMVNQCINWQLKKITNTMTGVDNAGKLFSSIKYFTEHGLEEWTIEEIPSNIKSFVDTILEYHKRADEVILEGKGLDASLSNVTKDGIISKSGSDAYYNYLIYQNSLSIPEYVCFYDINKAIQLNFPDKAGIKMGAYRNIIQRQQDTAPTDRMANNQPNN